MGIKIKNFFLLMVSAVTLLLWVLFFTVHQERESAYKLDKLVVDRHEMIMYSKVLRQSSDDLSKYSRLYSITLDEKYKEIYYNVLSIRNGETRRPLNYNLIYWDLLEPERSIRHPLEEKKALKEIIKKLPFDAFEYQKLADAQNNSDKLVALEIDAINMAASLSKDEKGNLCVHKEQRKAIEILHSLEYLQAKEKIMLPIDEFLTHLENRTTIQINNLKNDIDLNAKNLTYVIIAFFIVTALFFFLMFMKILNPISYLTEEIHKFKDSIDSKSDDKIFYDDEIGYMSKQFYKMKNKIKNDTKALLANEKKIKEYLTLVDMNVITSSTDLKGKIISVSEAFCSISGYSRDELLGKKHSMLKHKDMPQKIYEELWSTITQDETWSGELKNRRKDDSFYWVKATIYPIFNEENKKIGYTAIRVDVTDKKEIDSLLKSSKYNEKKILDYVNLVDKNITTSSTDAHGRITYVSEAFSRISGYSQEELLGRSHAMVKHSDMDARLYDSLWETITLNKTWHGEIKNRTKEGGFYWVDATIYPIFDINGYKVGYTAIRIDITDKKRIEELLETDALTGLYSRKHFNEFFPKKMEKVKEHKNHLSLLIMKIDFFKEYNDYYGQKNGDSILINLAKLLQNSLEKASDKSFRLSGEAFGVLFESQTPTQAYSFADAIRQNVENLKIQHENNQMSQYMTVSMGLATKSYEQEIVKDALYKEADDNLYKAREFGRNRIEANE